MLWVSSLRCRLTLLPTRAAGLRQLQSPEECLLITSCGWKRHILLCEQLLATSFASLPQNQTHDPYNDYSEKPEILEDLEDH